MSNTFTTRDYDHEGERVAKYEYKEVDGNLAVRLLEEGFEDHGTITWSVQNGQVNEKHFDEALRVAPGFNADRREKTEQEMKWHVPNLFVKIELALHLCTSRNVEVIPFVDREIARVTQIQNSVYAVFKDQIGSRFVPCGSVDETLAQAESQNADVALKILEELELMERALGRDGSLIRYPEIALQRLHKIKAALHS